jgi:hypothetical protein
MSNFTPTGDARTDIPNLIKWCGNGLTFVELLRYLPYLEGEFAYGNRDSNVIFWYGLSGECIDVLIDLIEAGAIYPSSTLPLTYFIDGQVPKLPVAKSNRRYKKPRWAPITFGLARSVA